MHGDLQCAKDKRMQQSVSNGAATGAGAQSSENNASSSPNKQKARGLAQQAKGDKAASFRNENALAVKVPHGDVYVEDRRLQTQATDDLHQLEMAAGND